MEDWGALMQVAPPERHSPLERVTTRSSSVKLALNILVQPIVQFVPLTQHIPLYETVYFE
jgi:hypothetical protein